MPAFTRENLVKHNQHLKACSGSGAYQFTDLGKIPVKALSLSRFNSVQEPLILQKLTQIEANIFNNQGTVLPEPELSFCLTDLRIYSSQLRKILLSTLYILGSKSRWQTLYKIGVTTRPVSQRIAEIDRDVRSHFQTVAINVLGTWVHRGNVEKYFKYRYSDFNYPIGSLTEYFQFVGLDDAQAVKHDLDSMQPKALSSLEQDILKGKPSPIEQALYAETKPLGRSRRGKPLKAASLFSELERVFLSSPSSEKVIKALHQSYSLRQAAEMASVSIDIARKVLAVLQKQ